MLNPTFPAGGGSSSGGGGLVDEDVEILVGPGKSFAAAKAEALTYHGRMAIGRTVTIRLPSGVTYINDLSDTSFDGWTFPELRLLGQRHDGISMSDVAAEFTIAADPDFDFTAPKAFPWDPVVEFKAFTVRIDMSADSGAVVGERFIVEANSVYGTSTVAPEFDVGWMFGCHEVVDVDGNAVVVRVWVPSDYAAAFAALGAFAASDMPRYMSGYRVSSILSTGALEENETFLSIVDCNLGAVGDFALVDDRDPMTVDPSQNDGMLQIIRSTINNGYLYSPQMLLSRLRPRLGIVPALKAIPYFSTTIVSSRVEFGTYAQTTVTGESSILVLGGSDVSFGMGISGTGVGIRAEVYPDTSGSPSVGIWSGTLHSVPAYGLAVINAHGPVDVYASALVLVPSGAVQAIASNGARVLVNESVTETSPALGVAGNGGALISTIW